MAKVVALTWCLLFGPVQLFGQSFVNFETGHVSPLSMTPDGSKLLAVNTADNRLEVFDLADASVAHVGSVPVGLDPVSVRARTNTEAWVVNLISDSISIVNLTTMNVSTTLHTADEPADVVFSTIPLRAFVSCSQANLVQVFNPTNLAAAPLEVVIEGEDPRAMAVSADGSKVYVAIFESGNNSTILGGGSLADGDDDDVITFPPNVVNDPSGPYGGYQPPAECRRCRGYLQPATEPGEHDPAAGALPVLRADRQPDHDDDAGGTRVDAVSRATAVMYANPCGSGGRGSQKTAARPEALKR